jgi:hypothetical protein
MADSVWSPEFARKEEPVSHRIARSTITAVGRAGFLVLVVDGRSVAVAPRRGNSTVTESARQVHAGAARTRSEEIIAFSRTLELDADAPDPAVLAGGREYHIAETPGDPPPDAPNLVRIVLRGAEGLQLRRTQADELAATIEALVQRSRRASRRRTERV